MSNTNKNVQPGIVFVDGRSKTPNERQYLVLLSGDYKDNDNQEYRDFEWIVGRQRLYDYLRDLILSEDDVIIDIHKSLIISETVTINDYVSVYEFMRAVKNIVIDETGFDIEEYNIEGIMDEESED